MYCWSCGKSPQRMGRCEGCGKASYCDNNKCQEVHWEKKHSKHCNNINGMTQMTISDFAETDLYKERFYDLFFNGKQTIIGRGGRGIAFINKDFPGIVLKKSDNIDICRGNNEEYKTIKAIEQSLQGLDFGTVSLIKTYNYAVDDFLQCYIVMDHIRKPLMNLNHKEASHESYQAYMGEENYHKVHPSRGEYIGRGNIKKLFQKYNDAPEDTILLTICQDMARFIASIHLIAKYDGVDIEFILGHIRSEPRKVGIVALDFDLCKEILDFSPGYQGGVEQCAWSLAAEDYFPHWDPNNPKDKYYALFKKTYLDVGASMGMQFVAEDIMKAYERHYN